MNRLILLALLIFNPNLWAGEFHPFNGPKPIAVIIQTDPWAMVMGADIPRVVAYEDGTIIFLKKSKENVSYYFKRLSESALSDFKKHLAPVVALKDLKRSYSLRPNVTDQPETLFYLLDGSRSFTTRVYGLKTAGTKLPAYTVLPNVRKSDSVPDELLELHKFLCSVDYSDSKEWNPKYVEIMIWPYEYAPDASIKWPKEWPGLNSERSLKRGDSYSIFLDGDLLPELRNFLKTQKEKGAVDIEGKKWAVSFRSVFPSEPVWMKAFKKSEVR